MSDIIRLTARFNKEVVVRENNLIQGKQRAPTADEVVKWHTQLESNLGEVGGRIVVKPKTEMVAGMPYYTLVVETEINLADHVENALKKEIGGRHIRRSINAFLRRSLRLRKKIFVPINDDTIIRCRAEFENKANGHPLADAVPNEPELAEWRQRMEGLMAEEGFSSGDLTPFSESGVPCLALAFVCSAKDFNNKHDRLLEMFKRQVEKGQRAPFTLPFRRIRVGASPYNF